MLRKKKQNSGYNAFNVLFFLNKALTPSGAGVFALGELPMALSNPVWRWLLEPFLLLSHAGYFLPVAWPLKSCRSARERLLDYTRVCGIHPRIFYFPYFLAERVSIVLCEGSSSSVARRVRTSLNELLLRLLKTARGAARPGVLLHLLYL